MHCRIFAVTTGVVGVVVGVVLGVVGVVGVVGSVAADVGSTVAASDVLESVAVSPVLEHPSKREVHITPVNLRLRMPNPNAWPGRKSAQARLAISTIGSRAGELELVCCKAGRVLNHILTSCELCREIRDLSEGAARVDAGLGTALWRKLERAQIAVSESAKPQVARFATGRKLQRGIGRRRLPDCPNSP